ncbi:signal transducer and activator of transcription (STAT) family protein [Tieghemostelium lacteum]|uniref:Signal transducer and activator of transcription (STAT) family protein n=1 Tax=Tieghemostelium lacteum TaxID=361077 RepID=A0A151ZGF2_TIELA|nr:signal transducer and activator of transcription (STAT) family protein [Tieghemostelium lacteum]|eukprot:KYQ93051.1 signal transducer and activator of transcription (STAT) family protein [Tieghemostelium lacteum]
MMSSGRNDGSNIQLKSFQIQPKNLAGSTFRILNEDSMDHDQNDGFNPSSNSGTLPNRDLFALPKQQPNPLHSLNSTKSFEVLKPISSNNSSSNSPSPKSHLTLPLILNDSNGNSSILPSSINSVNNNNNNSNSKVIVLENSPSSSSSTPPQSSSSTVSIPTVGTSLLGNNHNHNSNNNNGGVKSSSDMGEYSAFQNYEKQIENHLNQIQVYIDRDTRHRNQIKQLEDQNMKLETENHQLKKQNFELSRKLNDIVNQMSNQQLQQPQGFISPLLSNQNNNLIKQHSGHPLQQHNLLNISNHKLDIQQITPKKKPSESKKKLQQQQHQLLQQHNIQVKKPMDGDEEMLVAEALGSFVELTNKRPALKRSNSEEFSLPPPNQLLQHNNNNNINNNNNNQQQWNIPYTSPIDQTLLKKRKSDLSSSSGDITLSNSNNIIVNNLSQQSPQSKNNSNNPLNRAISPQSSLSFKTIEKLPPNNNNNNNITTTTTTSSSGRKPISVRTLNESIPEMETDENIEEFEFKSHNDESPDSNSRQSSSPIDAPIINDINLFKFTSKWL